MQGFERSERPPNSDVAAALKRRVQRRRQQLRALLDVPASSGSELALRHSDVMDGVLRTLFSRSAAPESMLVGAVGGYGRRQLGWHSELDLAFIAPDSVEAVRSCVEDMLYPLWDAGLKVRHQVLTAHDVASLVVTSLPTATGLLDFRPVAGNMLLWRQMHQQVRKRAFNEQQLPALVEQLEQLCAERHARFGASVYLLEPDVKDGVGGLRDFDVAMWAARARYGTTTPHDLTALGLWTSAQAQDVMRAQDLMWSVRNHLHDFVGRRADRLTFLAQEELAERLGYADKVSVPGEASEIERTGMLVEAFMSDYYRHARVLTQMRERVLGRVKRRRDTPALAPIAGGWVAGEQGIGFADLEQPFVDPVACFRLYAAAIAQGKFVLARSRDAIMQATAEPGFSAQVCEHPEACALFVGMAVARDRSPFVGRSILAELHDVGLLLAMIPEFAPVVGRVHHDAYHVYTVDVHSVAAVDRLHQLVRGELIASLPLACRLAAEVTRPAMLVLAVLLHDVGKNIGGHDHAGRGAEMARGILTRLGLEPADVDDACHLIREHLILYSVAMRRDLSNPETVADFMPRVGSREQLRNLYLLTVADVSTTSPQALTKWKSTMLDALFRAADAFAVGAPHASARVHDVRGEVQRLGMGAVQLVPSELDAYLSSMPERYLLANAPGDIVQHAALAIRSPTGSTQARPIDRALGDPLSLCVVGTESAGLGFWVVAGDRPGLLANIAAALCANHLQVRAAQIHSRKLGSGMVQAVDIFELEGPTGEHELSERGARVDRDLKALLAGKVTPEWLMRSAARKSPQARPGPELECEVLVDDSAAEAETVVEVLAKDRPGLLCHLAAAFTALELTITVAKISTEATRAIDVFYVTELDGSKVQSGPRTEEVRARLMHVLRDT